MGDKGTTEEKKGGDGGKEKKVKQRKRDEVKERVEDMDGVKKMREEVEKGR
jgi:hypothetical protein